MKKTRPTPAAMSAFQARWQTLAAREQNMLLLAASVVGLALLWWLALAPALHSLRTADARRTKADQQLSQMQRMQSEAEQLRKQPMTPVDDARQLLQASLTQELGNSAQLNWIGNRAQITFKATPAPALARWLAQVRSNTHAVATEFKLNKTSASSTSETKADTSNASTLHWDGSLLLDWPGSADAAL